MKKLKQEIIDEIIKCCRKYNADKVILFGSRARGDNGEYSDIDLAVAGATDFDRLFAELKYNEFTLLEMDIINLDEKISEELRKDILKDGCILYQKGGQDE